MQRKIFLLCLPLFLLAFALVDSQVQAQSAATQTTKAEEGVVNNKFMPPVPSDTNPTFLGQDHAYSVTFRGNGEAVVSFKAIFTNNGEGPLTDISLRVPRIDPKDISVYQVVREPFNCLRYKPVEDLSPQTYLYYPVPTVKPVQRICEEYSPPDYYQTYWSGKTRYQKAKFEVKSDTISVTLPKEVKVGTSGSFILYYRAFGFARKNLAGTFDFTFETLKVDDKIRNLRVGITTDSDLYLRGARAKVNYRFDQGVAQIAAPKAASELVSPKIDTYYQQIGRGTIEKTASNLQPFDSYTVKGSFADSKLKLYAKEIFWGMIAFVAIIGVLFFLIRYFYRMLGRQIILKQSKKTAAFSSPVLPVFGISFVSSILIVLYTIALWFVVRNLFYLEFSQLLLLVLFSLSIVIYSLLFFGPAVFLGARNGLGWGIGTLVATILFLGFYLFLLVIFLFLITSRHSYPPPIPMMQQIFQ